MGKSTISMAIFNSYVSLPEGNQQSEDVWVYRNKVIIPKFMVIFWVGFHDRLSQLIFSSWVQTKAQKGCMTPKSC